MRLVESVLRRRRVFSCIVSLVCTPKYNDSVDYLVAICYSCNVHDSHYTVAITSNKLQDYNVSYDECAIRASY